MVRVYDGVGLDVIPSRYRRRTGGWAGKATADIVQVTKRSAIEDQK
jgi:hypothetical protein